MASLDEFLQAVKQADEFPTFGNIQRVKIIMESDSYEEKCRKLSHSDVTKFIQRRRNDICLWSIIMIDPNRYAP